MVARGRPLGWRKPNPLARPFMMRLSEKMHDDLMSLARMLDLSTSEVVRRMIVDWVDNHGVGEAIKILSAGTGG